jgi:hypothetical protein
MVLRWVLAGLLVLAAAMVVFITDPTTCDVDICSANAVVDVGIYLVGILAAVLVLMVRKR